MTVGAADIHKAVASLWVSSGLNTKFQSYWSLADRSLYASLNEMDAAPKTPFPYAVFSVRQSSLRARMSGVGAEKRHVLDHPWTFELYAEASGLSSPKEVAAHLAEEVMKIFGGHPVTEPTDMTLDHGSLLIVQYQADWCEKSSDDVYKWTIEYNFRVDIPVMV